MDQRLGALGLKLMAPAVIAGTVAGWGAITAAATAAAPFIGAAIVIGVII